MGNTKEMDMLSGKLAGKLILFSLPLACSSILQQLFNSADVAVVGRFAGDRALTAVTFTSQNYGAGNLKRCWRVFLLCMLFGIGFTEILSIIFIVFSDFFVSIYTTSAAVAVYAIIRMQHVCSMEGVTATYEVGSASLRGMGKSTEPSIITILGTVVFRMIWMVTIFKWIPTYDILMNVYIASWIFTGGLIILIYLLHMKKTEHRFAERQRIIGQD